MKRLPLFIVAAAVLLSTAHSEAQPRPPKRASSTGGISPHETTSAVIDGCRVTITYGRPFTKDPKTGEPRKIWGELVPWDKAWRTGADEATVLITQKPIMFGDTVVPAGAYTLYTIPSDSGTSKLAISKNLGAWGVPVNENNDLARVDMKKGPAEKQTDQFTMAVAKNPDGGGLIRLTWEDTQFTAPFAVKK
jgi:hypothetical protein